MITCPTCGGRGEVLAPTWYWLQLREFGAWSDYLDYRTLDEAVTKATSMTWPAGMRIKLHGRIVWTSHSEVA
jgi:hypothetical protein